MLYIQLTPKCVFVKTCETPPHNWSSLPPLTERRRRRRKGREEKGWLGKMMRYFNLRQPASLGAATGQTDQGREEKWTLLIG